MARVTVVGAGPAGAAAAISALRRGAAVELFEKSKFPRHRVCGEFLSPEAGVLLDRLGVNWRAANPAPLRQLMLCFGGRESCGPLPETAYGLSRYALDQMLLDHAVRDGAALRRSHGVSAGERTVIATGRKSAAPKGHRLFGFKAHFCGPASDIMELHFLGGGAYVGVNAIEEGRTNVCGVAPENALAAASFRIDDYLNRMASRTLRARLRGLNREWEWLRVGPLVFENRLAGNTDGNFYHCGDSVSFIDPFTGSGILSALLTGTLAGEAAAEGVDVEVYRRRCKRLLGRPFRMASLFRLSIRLGIASWAERWVPHRMLFRLTRPALPLVLK